MMPLPRDIVMNDAVANAQALEDPFTVQAEGQVDDNLVPISESSRAIQLKDDERQALRFQMQQMFDVAKTARKKVDDELPALRQFSELQYDRKPLYTDGPNVVTPIIAKRNSGMKALLRQTIMRKPLFRAASNSGQGYDAVTAYETALDHELRSGDSADQIALAIDDAVDTHAAFLRLDVLYASREDGSSAQVGEDYSIRVRQVPIEDFYCYPTNTMDFRHLSTFERRRYQYWELLEQAEAGYFDSEAVKRLRGSISAKPSIGQKLVGLDDGQAAAIVDWQPVTIISSWIRRGRELWHVVWHEDTNEILRAEPNYLPMDEPPYISLVANPKPRSALGIPPSKLLRAYQDTMDAAFNAVLAEYEFSSSPPIIIYDQQLWDEMNNKGWSPGTRFQASRRLGEKPFDVFNIPLNPASIQLMSLVEELAEDAVPSTPGLPSGGRKTKFESMAWVGANNARLGVLIENITRGLDRLAVKMWKLYRHYKVGDITPVFKFDSSGGSGGVSGIMFLGKRGMILDVPSTENTQQRAEAYAHIARQFGLPPEIGLMISNTEPPETEKLVVHSVWRNDIYWETNGGQTEPERVARMQSLQYLTQPFIIQLIALARKDRGVWNLMAKEMETAGVLDYREILGKSPNEYNQQALEMAAPLLARMQQGQQGQPAQ